MSEASLRLPIARLYPVKLARGTEFIVSSGIYITITLHGTPPQLALRSWATKSAAMRSH